MSDKMIGREIAERLNAGKHVSGPWELHHYMSEHGERWIIEKIQQSTRHAAEVERLRKLCGEAEEREMVLIADRDAALTLAESLRKKLDELAAALAEYKCHAYDCAKWDSDGSGRHLSDERQCTCGYSKIDPVAILAARDKAIRGPLEEENTLLRKELNELRRA